MKIRVFRSGKGDALLLTSDQGKHILVDGGVPAAYEEHWATPVGKLRDDNEPLELVCVSHIDRDHIGGVLEMVDNEVAWRLFEARSTRPELRRGVRRLREPALKRPPEVKAIWHNAFLETVRQRRVTNAGTATLDAAEILSRCALIHAGAGDMEIAADDKAVPLTAAQVADRMRFIGQSVGDAIELSRRVGPKQLKIPVNPQFGGNFVVRKRGEGSFDVAGFQITVLGPTAGELDELRTTWNEWLEEKAAFLRRLQKKHDEDAGKLASTSVSDILESARQGSIALAGNQQVTAPNLASIILLVENAGRSILLTGDADDPSIIKGLKARGLLDGNGQARVDVFKIPHHGAHNSYSDELARTVIADDYVFCGSGEHDNPEPDVLDGYLKVLLEGDNDHPPALPNGLKPKFWFNSGPALAESSKLEQHWNKVETTLERWQTRHPRRFTFKFQGTGDGFLVT